ncbi:MAG: hypothetical protein WBI04_07575 [Trichlorobacter sp.]
MQGRQLVHLFHKPVKTAYRFSKTTHLAVLIAKCKLKLQVPCRQPARSLQVLNGNQVILQVAAHLAQSTPDLRALRLLMRQISKDATSCLERTLLNQFFCLN